jgi:hypothetical protein
VASIALQADSLKLDGPNTKTVVEEIEGVQSVLTEVKDEIAKARDVAKAEQDTPEDTPEDDTPKGAVETLEEVAEALKVRKAGAKMSAARLKRFATALKELQSLLREVEGDTKKDVSPTPSPTPTEPEPEPEAEAASTDEPAVEPEGDSAVVKTLRGEVEDLRKQVQVLKSAPAPSQALAVEPSEPTPVSEEDYDWPADMNKPLGEGDVPVEKSFHG